jgi:hypothetical protein
MPLAKAQTARRTHAQESPELLISFLQYALDDVRSLSERGGRHLELAISALAEDTRGINLSKAVSFLRQQS